MTALTSSSSSNTKLCLSACLKYGSISVEEMLFIDSGADSCFMDLTWCQNMGFPLTEISPPHSLVLAGGQSDPSRSIKHRTVATQAKIGDHYELISFHVCNLGHPVILGFDWLSRHNPDIDSSISNLTFKFEFCLSHCCPTISKPSCSASPSSELLLHRQKLSALLSKLILRTTLEFLLLSI